MASPSFQERRRLESLDRDALAQHQLRRLNQLLDAILPANAFYAEKLRGIRRPVQSLDELRDWPFTTKDELQDSASPWPRNLTFPLERYVRFHQTSGSTGHPLAVLDTAEDWQRWLEVWQYVLDAAELQPGERALLAFSFGPFIGFWTAFDALVQRGCLAIPSGGMSTLARLDLIQRTGTTALFCTPTYALHLAEIAAAKGCDLRAGTIRKIIVAGEPGGSLPATRARIESAWNARVIDHAGATEVGPWGCADAAGRGLHIIESEFIAEFIHPQTGQCASTDAVELVLTNLFRAGCPVIRYRTGDMVRPATPPADASPPADAVNRFVRLEGGVLGRADDMLIIRGVIVFPSAIEQVVRSVPGAGEFRATFFRQGELDQVRVEVESALEIKHRLVDEFRVRLGLNVHVVAAPPGSLPRSEGKAKRLIDERRSK